jgi:hypothetical protein
MDKHENKDHPSSLPLQMALSGLVAFMTKLMVSRILLVFDALFSNSAQSLRSPSLFLNLAILS